jgi:hypothetical protein
VSPDVQRARRETEIDGRLLHAEERPVEGDVASGGREPSGDVDMRADKEDTFTTRENRDVARHPEASAVKEILQRIPGFGNRGS